MVATVTRVTCERSEEFTEDGSVACEGSTRVVGTCKGAVETLGVLGSGRALGTLEDRGTLRTELHRAREDAVEQAPHRAQRRRQEALCLDAPQTLVLSPHERRQRQHSLALSSEVHYLGEKALPRDGDGARREVLLERAHDAVHGVSRQQQGVQPCVSTRPRPRPREQRPRAVQRRARPLEPQQKVPHARTPPSHSHRHHGTQHRGRS